MRKLVILSFLAFLSFNAFSQSKYQAILYSKERLNNKPFIIFAFYSDYSVVTIQNSTGETTYRTQVVQRGTSIDGLTTLLVQPLADGKLINTMKFRISQGISSGKSINEVDFLFDDIGKQKSQIIQLQNL